jgi:tetratricopeptide (TPR) repeat protein
MLTATVLDHWIPVTWFTFGLDYVVWGLRPLGYHLTNVILHAVGAALFFAVARRLLRAARRDSSEPALIAGAAVAALIFAIHPLRAESVAWVTQRRDVLSGAFFFLTILWYLVAAESTGRRRTRFLAASATVYALALASKSTVVTLPFVLALLDVYPLRRLSFATGTWRTTAGATVLREKLLYLALAVAGGSLEVLAGRSSLTSLDTLPILERIPLVAYSLWFYLSRTIAPVALSPLYELPARVTFADARFAVAAIAVVAITVTLVAARRRWPSGLAAWVAYVILLAPVSGIVHNGFQLVSDRYSYLSCVPWALLAGAGVQAIVTARERSVVDRRLASAMVTLILVWIGVLGVLATWQSTVWASGLTLWRRAVDAEPGCSVCHANLGVALVNERQFDASVREFRTALALRPGRDFVHAYLGIALLSAAERGGKEAPANVRDAAEHLTRALARDPGDVVLLTHLGIALSALGRPADARPHLERAVLRNPRGPLAHFWLARVYAATGESAKAQAETATVRALDPRLGRELDTLLAR